MGKIRYNSNVLDFDTRWSSIVRIMLLQLTAWEKEPLIHILLWPQSRSGRYGEEINFTIARELTLLPRHSQRSLSVFRLNINARQYYIILLSQMAIERV
jgi:hypothetical protein